MFNVLSLNVAISSLHTHPSHSPTHSPHTPCLQLFVTIMDQNDNSPVFQNDPYLAEVTEGVDVGFDTGIVVMATDRDKDTFGTVSYILTKNESECVKPIHSVIMSTYTVIYFNIHFKCPWHQGEAGQLELTLAHNLTCA